MTAPTSMWVVSPHLPPEHAAVAAYDAAVLARKHAPKLSGLSASRIQPVAGAGFFGLSWEDPQVWFQERGTRASTMNSLAGKTIPMWIDDPTGEERRKNPKADTRITASGKTQVLIFRRAARHGQRKTVRRRVNGRMQKVNVPASYPGAPGRIARRHVARPDTVPGKVPGAIATTDIRPHVGVRWRNPGVVGRHFIENALRESARANHVTLRTIRVG